MKKILCLMLVCSLFFLTGCQKDNDVEQEQEQIVEEETISFKDDYESLNDNEDFRKVEIDEDNPYVYVTAEEIVKKISDKETFFLYVGDKQCPWCRSVIEKSIEVAKKKNIDKIYYINIWDDDHNEILRDTYELDKDNKPTLVNKGTNAYYTLLESFGNLLKDYTLKTKKGKEVSVGEKRIFAPTYFYIKDGVAKKSVEGISKLQKDPNMELSKKILSDEEKTFTSFFTE